MENRSLKVSWGGGEIVVSVTPSAAAWENIDAGSIVKIQGEGYFYDGEEFQDTWYFNSDGPGTLRVCYDDADGFVGNLSDALDNY